jgi:hypothetical protein
MLSSPAMSETLRAIGPPVSRLRPNGMIPLRLARPVVGFSPTMPLTEDGARIEPIRAEAERRIARGDRNAGAAGRARGRVC